MVMRALHSPQCSVVAALESVICEQGAPCVHMHRILRTAPHPVPWACPLEQLARCLTPSYATLAPDIPGHLPRVCDTQGSGRPQLCLVEQAGARALTETDSSMSFLLRRAWLIRSTIQSNRALYRDLAMESRAVIACGHTAGSVTL